MIPDFDKNAVFIWACYAIGALSLGLTLMIVLWRERTSRAHLENLQTRQEDESAS